MESGLSDFLVFLSHRNFFFLFSKGSEKPNLLHAMIMSLRTPLVWNSFSVFPDFPDLEFCEDDRPLIFGMFLQVGFLMFPHSKIQVMHL